MVPIASNWGSEQPPAFRYRLQTSFRREMADDPRRSRPFTFTPSLPSALSVRRAATNAGACLAGLLFVDSSSARGGGSCSRCCGGGQQAHKRKEDDIAEEVAVASFG